MSNEIIICKDTKLGTWQGLGGAITEATAYNYAKLSPAKQKQFLDAYYGKNDLDYRWGRLSIGSNDFCLKPYEYTKLNDLSDFSIKHDEKWLLPMLKEILKKKNLSLVASPWSPPKQMKIGFKRSYYSILKPWCYTSYTEYIHKWLEAYAEQGVKIKYLTPQNEPHAGQIWESCVYTYRAQRKLAYKYLATIDDYDFQILLWDHNKKKLGKVARKLLNGKYVTKIGRTEKVAGIGYHWYNGIFPDQMWQVRQQYSDILMVSTEMSCGFSPYNERDWQNDAKLYYRELFADINTGATAFIDWNMLLSWQGGPSYCKNYVKSPIILNKTNDDLILTPIYNALKKFVKLFPAGSRVIRCEYESDDIVAITREMEQGYEVVVANVSDKEQEVTIRLDDKLKKLSIAESEIKSVKIR